MAPSATTRGKRKREDTPPTSGFITFVLPERQLVFDRLLDATSLDELKNLARERLDLSPDANVSLTNLRGSDEILIHDDRDFAAFVASSRHYHHSRVRINVVESTEKESVDSVEGAHSEAPVSKRRKAASDDLDDHSPQTSTSKAESSTTTALPTSSVLTSQLLLGGISTLENLRSTLQKTAIALTGGIVDTDGHLPETNERPVTEEPVQTGKRTGKRSSTKSKGKKAQALVEVEELIESGSRLAPADPPPPSPDSVEQPHETHSNEEELTLANGEIASVHPEPPAASTVVEPEGAPKKRKKKKKAGVDPSEVPHKRKKRRNSTTTQSIGVDADDVVQNTEPLQASHSGPPPISGYEEESTSSRPAKGKLKVVAVPEDRFLHTQQAAREAVDSPSIRPDILPFADDATVQGEAIVEGSSSAAQLPVNPPRDSEVKNGTGGKPHGTKKKAKKPKTKQSVAPQPILEVPPIPSDDSPEQPPDAPDSVVEVLDSERTKRLKQKSKKAADERGTKPKAPKPVTTATIQESESLGNNVDVEMGDISNEAPLPDAQGLMVATLDTIRQSSPCLDSIRRSRKYPYPPGNQAEPRAPEPDWTATEGSATRRTIMRGKSPRRLETSSSTPATDAPSRVHNQEDGEDEEDQIVAERSESDYYAAKPPRRRFSSLEVKTTNPGDDDLDLVLHSPDVEILPAPNAKHHNHKVSSGTVPAISRNKEQRAKPIQKRTALDSDDGSSTDIRSRPLKGKARPSTAGTRESSIAAGVHSSTDLARSTSSKDAESRSGDSDTEQDTRRPIALSPSRTKQSVGDNSPNHDVEPIERDEDDKSAGEGDDGAMGEVLVPASQMSPMLVDGSKVHGFPVGQAKSALTMSRNLGGHRQKPSVSGWVPMSQSPQSVPATQSQGSEGSLVDQLPSDSGGEESDEAVIDESLKASSPHKSTASHHSSSSGAGSDSEDGRPLRRSARFPLPKSTQFSPNATQSGVPSPNGVHGVRPGHGLRTSLQNNSMTPLPHNIQREGLNRAQSASPYPSLNGLVLKRHAANQPTIRRGAPLRLPAQSSRSHMQAEQDSEDESNSESSEEDDAVPKNRRAGAGLNKAKQRRSRLSAFT
ncbi:hypothetical protein FRB93_001263 [Tulasnella sp. JGI-2019a]|nr:hypothetical protein FRB93_001263 [Tulasnella sp. JGI-2019a]